MCISRATLPMAFCTVPHAPHFFRGHPYNSSHESHTHQFSVFFHVFTSRLTAILNPHSSRIAAPEGGQHLTMDTITELHRLTNQHAVLKSGMGTLTLAPRVKGDEERWEEAVGIVREVLGGWEVEVEVCGECCGCYEVKRYRGEPMEWRRPLRLKYLSIGLRLKAVGRLIRSYLVHITKQYVTDRRYLLKRGTSYCSRSVAIRSL
ncbi:hypothetical protein BDV95DRAFT_537680 [Massariosphaeria phaeospora]|uniref:Uncharacterized protein n=1 Tax=Massariosphaeria phaeospora TaxID=100035 RepID=A0A7C8IFI4_9PLEO|nr:hypothetical protein BDV95DRAFT_537680 [Massariosphaeria phaeospora]